MSSSDSVASSPVVDTTTKSPVEVLYDELDRSFASLVMLCMGMKDQDGEDILNLTTEPWKSLESNQRAKKKIKQLKPSSEVMKSHVLWRWVNILNSVPPTPCPKQWPL